MDTPRILLADGHKLLIDGLRLLLLKHRCHVVGTVEDGQSVLSAVERLQPDVLVMDVAMPLLDGLQAGQRVRKQHPHVKLLFLSHYGDKSYVDVAMKIGASGYVLKRSGWGELWRAITAVLAGQQYESPELSIGSEQPLILPHIMTDGSAKSLTARQRSILKLVAAGYTANEIGRMLQISSKTVEFHKARLARQLRLRSIRELAHYAFTHGINQI